MRHCFFLFALIFLAGCNLETSGSFTPTPEPLPTTSYVPPTPYRGPTQIVAPTLIGGQGAGAQVVGVTVEPGRVVTPIPGQTIAQPVPSPASENAIEAFVNNILIPAWNFVYTFFLEGLSTLWLFAGTRGGAFAQVFCCIVPIVLVIGVVAVRFRLVRWRR